MEIIYKDNITPNIDQIIEVYKSSELLRPIDDIERIRNIYSNSNLVVSAWDNEKLVGISRSLTDFYYCCYLSDLAVRKEYQKKGIGKTLIEYTKKRIGEQVSLILLAAPEAMDYYPKVGFEKLDNAFIIRRKE